MLQKVLDDDVIIGHFAEKKSLMTLYVIKHFMFELLVWK